MVVVAVKNWNPCPPITSVTLVGRFIRIDPLRLDRDVPLLWDALGGNPKAVNTRLSWFGLPDLKGPKDLSGMMESIQGKQQEGWCVNVFRLIDNDQVVGMASYISTNSHHGTTEVGYVAHGRAMAQSPASTEVHYLLAKHAFEDCGYRRLEWKCDSNNEPSRRAATRYGYSYEGCFRQHRVTAKQTNRDTNWYSMLDSEWYEACKPAFEAWLDPSNFDSHGQQKRKLQEIRKSILSSSSSS
mmetsp:Transcript_30907/g.47381  ORF Transcript_30907/g.47381 Transcript_30907/m.47381 type:complete len:241 (-) Transcript_30907:328-1050(-)|eukprot:CAMPEP_0118693270 /NCGR_PEP_ID=MMETSP0800-20121206/11809_1 /TAXON_ID=210618 ORGANISM="Striatella unipunctata, Strain CCMP2910" /NCGR_SAMPLE_ID=MMETSP0800 /ASSEMBLY_ACC=CAM_ASM_000638 /LENGTH=240 /DNA_ID=CAMNT_0006591475 /DNA_START=175 /DNA_END=897 /DNA_ORIENTATION=-